VVEGGPTPGKCRALEATTSSAPALFTCIYFPTWCFRRFVVYDTNRSHCALVPEDSGNNHIGAATASMGPLSPGALCLPSSFSPRHPRPSLDHQRRRTCPHLCLLPVLCSEAKLLDRHQRNSRLRTFSAMGSVVSAVQGDRWGRRLGRRMYLSDRQKQKRKD